MMMMITISMRMTTSDNDNVDDIGGSDDDDDIDDKNGVYDDDDFDEKDLH